MEQGEAIFRPSSKVGEETCCSHLAALCTLLHTSWYIYVIVGLLYRNEPFAIHCNIVV